MTSPASDQASASPDGGQASPPSRRLGRGLGVDERDPGSARSRAPPRAPPPLPAPGRGGDRPRPPRRRSPGPGCRPAFRAAARAARRGSPRAPRRSPVGRAEQPVRRRRRRRPGRARCRALGIGERRLDAGRLDRRQALLAAARAAHRPALREQPLSQLAAAAAAADDQRPGQRTQPRRRRARRHARRCSSLAPGPGRDEDVARVDLATALRAGGDHVKGVAALGVDGLQRRSVGAGRVAVAPAQQGQQNRLQVAPLLRSAGTRSAPGARCSGGARRSPPRPGSRGAG